MGLERALEEQVVERSKLFIASKLWNTYHRKEHVRSACLRSLKDLRVAYLDLYYIHFPIPLKFVDFDTRYPPEWVHDPSAVSGRMEIDEGVSLRETWEAMEELVGEGLVRNIGVCNMQSAMLRDLLSYAHIKPAVLQVQQITQQSSSPIGPNSSSYHILALDPKPATLPRKPSGLKPEG